VTGGSHLNGFCKLIVDIQKASGLSDTEVFTGRGRGVIPGYYRPTKDWDIIAVAKNRDGKKVLVSCVEIKSQAGPSFGNNFNNRVEEALGNSTDFWTAYERELLPAHPRPFLGYVMLLEEAGGSTSKVATDAPNFPVDPFLKNASYKDRYQALCDRLVRERLYDATAFIVATREGGLMGKYSEPVQNCTFWSFASALAATALAFSNERSGAIAAKSFRD
jgi:hypothetical protein